MMAKRKHIPLFDDQLEILELLTDQEVGQAVLAAMRFMRSGTEAGLTGGAGVVYQMLRAQFVRNQNDAAVGKKGGRPRKNPVETPRINAGPQLLENSSRRPASRREMPPRRYSWATVRAPTG